MIINEDLNYFFDNENEYLEFKNYLIFDKNKNKYDLFLEYIKNQNTNKKLKILNKYIDKTLLSNNSKYDKIVQIIKFLNDISKEDEKEIILLKIINNFNLKNLLFSLVKNNFIDMTKINNDYKTDDFYLIIELFCEENDIEIHNSEIDSKYDDNVKLYLSDIGMYKRLTKDEENTLLLLIKNGDIEAKNKFITANLRLVVPIAARFYKIYKNFDFLDLIQEGNIYMVKAINKYDLSMNVKFSTYATKCINNGLKKYVLNNNKNIKLPYYVIYDLKKLNKVCSELEILLERKPSNLEIANKLGFTTDYVDKLLTLSLSEVSLNSKIGNCEDDESNELMYFIKDENENVENSVISNLNFENLLKIIDENNLKKRDLDIFFSYSDLGFNEPKSLTFLAKKYNVSSTRIKKIIEKVQTILKKDTRLNEYYYNLINYNKYKLEFLEKDELNKFNIYYDVFFTDGKRMAKWFYDNKKYIETSDDEIDKKIIKQYYLYIKLQFLMIKDYRKFISDSNIIIKDNINAGIWFLNNKINMENSNDEIDKKIIKQYKEYKNRKIK